MLNLKSQRFSITSFYNIRLKSQADETIRLVAWMWPSDFLLALRSHGVCPAVRGDLRLSREQAKQRLDDRSGEVKGILFQVASGS